MNHISDICLVVNAVLLRWVLFQTWMHMRKSQNNPDAFVVWKALKHLYFGIQIVQAIMETDV